MDAKRSKITSLFLLLLCGGIHSTGSINEPVIQSVSDNQLHALEKITWQDLPDNAKEIVYVYLLNAETINTVAAVNQEANQLSTPLLSVLQEFKTKVPGYFTKDMDPEIREKHFDFLLRVAKKRDLSLTALLNDNDKNWFMIFRAYDDIYTKLPPDDRAPFLAALSCAADLENFVHKYQNIQYFIDDVDYYAQPAFVTAVSRAADPQALVDNYHDICMPLCWGDEKVNLLVAVSRAADVESFIHKYHAIHTACAPDEWNPFLSAISEATEVDTFMEKFHALYTTLPPDTQATFIATFNRCAFDNVRHVEALVNKYHAILISSGPYAFRIALVAALAIPHFMTPAD